MPRNKKRHKKVVGLNGDQNRQLSSEEVTRVFGSSIVDSGCSSDTTEFASAQGSTSENEKGLYNSQEYTNLKYESACGDEPRKATTEICYEQTSSTPIASPLNESESSPSFQSPGLPVLDCSQPGKIRFLCSFGGKIMPRPSDKKLRYVGGDTRIITTGKNLSWKALMKKISAICEQPQAVKYQLPGEDLDALVSVSSDEDLQNMLEEYLGFEQVECFQRLRIFLFPLSESANSCTLDTNVIPQNDPEYQYVVAVNGMVGEDPSPLKNRTGQPLQGEASHLIPNVELDKLPRGTAVCPVLSSSEFHTVQVAENLMSLHPSRGIVTPSGSEEIDNNSEQCSSTGPIPKERTVKWEKPLSIPNNPIGALLGSNDSAGFHDGMSYAVSRSNFLESGGKSIYCSEEVLTPPAKLNFPVTHVSPQVASAASEEDAGRLRRSKRQFRDENSHNCLQCEVPEALGVGSNVPPDAESSLGRVHQVIGTVESSSPSTGATGSESVSQDSDSEDTYDGGGSCNELITDAMIAEMEANVYGLQIIRNAELEEIRELGSGTYGTVYHGKWRGTDVAIKRIKKACISGVSSEKERLIKDFWREARILSNLHHPNIVALYGIVPDGEGGTLATVTEYMSTGSLKNSLLKKDRSLDCPRRLMVALDAAFGMEYLHSKNIVHFDLKCENLLVNLWDPQRPICKVGDFGLSRIKHKTLLSGGVRGTLPWMAPELLNGSTDQVSEKVDVFSFGISMWEILTGEEPYADMHCGAIIGGIVKNNLRPPIPEGCDLHWKKLMEECWESDPEARPSFSEITRRLREMRVNLLDRWESNLSRQRKQNISM